MKEKGPKASELWGQEGLGDGSVGMALWLRKQSPGILSTKAPRNKFRPHPFPALYLLWFPPARFINKQHDKCIYPVSKLWSPNGTKCFKEQNRRQWPLYLPASVHLINSMLSIPSWINFQSVPLLNPCWPCVECTNVSVHTQFKKKKKTGDHSGNGN